MGMDVYGKNATAEVGGYFRNNVWWWHPLAEFLTTTYPDLTAGCIHWQSNDGDGLDAVASVALADALDRDLANGRVTAYADQYTAEQNDLPDSECSLCSGTGLRTDAVGQQYGYDKPRDPDTGKGGMQQLCRNRPPRALRQVLPVRCRERARVRRVPAPLRRLRDLLIHT